MILSKSGTETKTRGRAVALVLAGLAGLARAPAAHAGEGEAKAMAEALFREGKKLLDQGKVDEACAKLESSYKIDETLGTLLNLATCHEKQGRFATAWGEFNEARGIAKKAGQDKRVKFATEHVSAIEPRLSHLTVKVDAEARVDGLAVTVDKVALASGAWGTPVPVDPGDHVVAAEAPGRVRWESKATIKETESASIAVPALALAPKPAPVAPPPPRSRWKLPAGIAAAGAGAVGIGVGTFFGIRALSYASQSNQGCQPNGACTPSAYQAFTSGKSAATAADVLLTVGFALAGAGAVLLIVDAVEGNAARPAASGPVRFTAGPVLGPGLGGLSVGGVF